MPTDYLIDNNMTNPFNKKRDFVVIKYQNKVYLSEYIKDGKYKAHFIANVQPEFVYNNIIAALDMGIIEWIDVDKVKINRLYSLSFDDLRVNSTIQTKYELLSENILDINHDYTLRLLDNVDYVELKFAISLWDVYINESNSSETLHLKITPTPNIVTNKPARYGISPIYKHEVNSLLSNNPIVYDTIDMVVDMTTNEGFNIKKWKEIKKYKLRQNDELIDIPLDYIANLVTSTLEVFSHFNEKQLSEINEKYDYIIHQHEINLTSNIPIYDFPLTYKNYHMLTEYELNILLMKYDIRGLFIPVADLLETLSCKTK